MEEHRPRTLTPAMLYGIRSPVALLVLLAIMLLLPQANPENSLVYVRSAVPEEPWRLVTYAFVQFNYYQFFVSAILLVCFYVLFRNAFISLWWLGALVFSAACGTAGMYYYSPTVEWTAGLSSALHGLIMYIVLRSGASRAWLVFPVAKIVIEQTGFIANNPWLLENIPRSWKYLSTPAMVDNPLAMDANFWCACGGLFFFLMYRSATNVLAFISVARES